jgi:hypothetical protein
MDAPSQSMIGLFCKEEWIGRQQTYNLINASEIDSVLIGQPPAHRHAELGRLHFQITAATGQLDTRRITEPEGSKEFNGALSTAKRASITAKARLPSAACCCCRSDRRR